MQLYTYFAEKLQFVSPKFYKERFFKRMKNLSPETILNTYLEPELVWVQSILKSDDIILEIGANVGAYLFLFEQKTLAENIFAFEPNKKMFERLERIFPNISIFSYALSDKNGKVNFKIPVINGKELNSRGTLQTQFLEENEEKTLEYEVETLRLDDWVEKQKLSKIDFIKIDVEGHEWEVLKGAEKTIQKFLPKMMVEMEQRHHEKPIWSMIEEIKKWGYDAFYLSRETFSLEPLHEEILLKQKLTSVTDKKNYINNLIFLPKR